MNMSSQKCGLWNNFAAGTGGDLFDLIAIIMCDLPDAKADFPRVLRTAAQYAGVFENVSQDPDVPLSEEDKRKRQEQAANQVRKRRDAERHANKCTAELIALMRKQAKPVEATPAQIYLERRGIVDMPHGCLGYLGPLVDLPERLRKLVYSPKHPALVIWAQDGSGNITGGQRILIDEQGIAHPSQPNKPAFGIIGANPARFYMPASQTEAETDRTVSKGPLVIAEGPECALTICAATEYETWAVFGVGGWKNAPLPKDRNIILCPDRDHPDSPAAKAFKTAIGHHLDRGCSLAVALAPEEEGSKRDLNDTCKDRGYNPVREAIENAKPVGNHNRARKAAGSKAITVDNKGAKADGEDNSDILRVVKDPNFSGLTFLMRTIHVGV